MKSLFGYTDPFISPISGSLASIAQFPDLTSGKAWVGDINNRPVETDILTGLPDLNTGYVWIGDSDNKPVQSFKVIDLRIDVNSIFHQLSTIFDASFVMNTAPAYFKKAQSLGSLQSGVLKNTVTDGIGLLSQAIPDEDYMAGLDLSLPNAVPVFADPYGKKIKMGGVFDNPVIIDGYGNVRAEGLMVRNTLTATGFKAPSISDGSMIFLPAAKGYTTQVLAIFSTDVVNNAVQTFWMTLPGTVTTPKDPNDPYPPPIWIPIPDPEDPTKTPTPNPVTPTPPITPFPPFTIPVLPIPPFIPFPPFGIPVFPTPGGGWPDNSVPTYKPTDDPTPTGDPYQVTPTPVTIDPDTGDLDTPGDMTAGGFTTPGDITAGGNVTAGKNVIADENLQVGGDAQIDGDVDVEGEVNVHNNLNVDNNLNAGDIIAQNHIEAPELDVVAPNNQQIRILPPVVLPVGYSILLPVAPGTKDQVLTQGDNGQWEWKDPSGTITFDPPLLMDIVYGTLTNLNGSFSGFASLKREHDIKIKSSYLVGSGDYSSSSLSLLDRYNNGYRLKSTKSGTMSPSLSLQWSPSGTFADIFSFDGTSFNTHGYTIDDLPLPTSSNQVANKAYVDAHAGGGGTVTSITAGTGLTATPNNPITGSGTISIANTSVTAGSYRLSNVTVNAQGQLTTASSGSPASTTSRAIPVYGNTTGSSLLNTSVTIDTGGNLKGTAALSYNQFPIQLISGANSTGYLGFLSGTDPLNDKSLQIRLNGNLSSNVLWYLPTTNSTGCLSNNGSGTLSWDNVVGGFSFSGTTMTTKVANQNITIDSGFGNLILGSNGFINLNAPIRNHLFIQSSGTDPLYPYSPHIEMARITDTDHYPFSNPGRACIFVDENVKLRYQVQNDSAQMVTYHVAMKEDISTGRIYFFDDNIGSTTANINFNNAHVNFSYKAQFYDGIHMGPTAISFAQADPATVDASFGGAIFLDLQRRLCFKRQDGGVTIIAQ